MRRENKLALIIGFSVLLVVAVLVSDHLSQATRDQVADGLDNLARLPDESLLFDKPLNGDDRAAQGTRHASAPPAVEPWTDRQAGGPTVASREPAGTTSLADAIASRTVVPVSDEGRGDGPMVLSNGPAAEQIAQNGGPSDPHGARSDLLGLDTSKIRALLEVARSHADDPDREKTPVDGHIPSAGKYVVQPNDTLYEICQRLYGSGERWHELAALNEGKVGSDGTVYVGVTLTLMPGARSAAVTPEASRPATPVTAKNDEKTRRYTVKRGDTLSQIAQREVGSVRYLDEIRDLNPSLKKNKDQVMVGQTLVLPARRAG
ncbi:MAG: LysM peptidoglycan-binding domain-containing protein [Phycisphaeraceae bacterium]|nr:MAG: LysM peptidoglycan-binding domain-containing protein [Phycisphaeraceae bacterium]